MQALLLGKVRGQGPLRACEGLERGRGKGTEIEGGEVVRLMGIERGGNEGADSEGFILVFTKQAKLQWWACFN